MASQKSPISCSAPLEVSDTHTVLPKPEYLSSSEPTNVPPSEPSDSTGSSKVKSEPPVSSGSSEIRLASSTLPSTFTDSTHEFPSDTSADIVSQPSGSSNRRVHLLVEEIRLQWNMNKIIQRLSTHQQCLKFAEEKKLLSSGKQCYHHKRPMSLSIHKGLVGSFRCQKSRCRTKCVSRAIGTWFENVHLSLTLVFKLMYLFSRNYCIDLAQLETVTDDRDSVLSTVTIVNWYSRCREAVVVYELEHKEEQTKIGGPNKIVQIDESKFEKGKYNRGRHLEGHWVLGMIEDGNDDLRLEVCPNNERSIDVLLPLIKKHVQEGSIICTDSWKEYECLAGHGYVHKKCSHSDTDNAPDTQRILSYWRGLKRTFNLNQFKGNFTEWLIEFSWRRRIRINHLDPFEELLKVIKCVYKIGK